MIRRAGRKKSIRVSAFLLIPKPVWMTSRSLCRYSVCAGDVSGLRQGCQLTEAAQHERVRLGGSVGGWGSLMSPGPADVSMKLSISLTTLLQAQCYGILNMHAFKRRLALSAWGLTRANRCLTTNLLLRGEVTAKHPNDVSLCF